MRKNSLTSRMLPGPWSWQHTAAAASVGLCAFVGYEIAGERGAIVGLLTGVAVAIVVLLVWVSRPRKID